MSRFAWKKYLPVIKMLLKRSVSTEQSMSLDRIDFEKQGARRKISGSFSIEIKHSRLNRDNKSNSAIELLELMMEDEIIKDLLRTNHYVITLDSSYLLTIKNITEPTEKAVVPDEPSEVSLTGDEPSAKNKDV